MVSGAVSGAVDRAATAVLGTGGPERHELPEQHERADGERPERVEMERTGGGLLGMVSGAMRTVTDATASALTAAAPTIDSIRIGGSTNLFTTAELAEDIQDAGRSASDFVDEDLRENIEVSTGHFQPVIFQGDRNFRLEDPRAQAEVRQRTRTLFNGIDGVGTDPALVRDALRGASPETIRAMRSEYARTHGGRDMLHEIDMDTSGAFEDEIEGMLTGDPIEQAAVQIQGAMRGMDTDPATIDAAISAVPEGQQREALLRRLGGDIEGRLLREAGPDGRVAMARLQNNEAQAIAYRLDDQLNNGVMDVLGRQMGIDDLGGPDRDEVYRILENVPEDRRADVIAAYGNIGDRPGGGTEGREQLRDALTRELDEGPERDRALALMDGHRDVADAAAIRLTEEEPWYENEAIIGAILVATPLAPVGAVLIAHAAANQACNGSLDLNSTDTEGLMRRLEQRPGEDRPAFIERMRRTREAYNHEYGNGDTAAFDNMLNSELGEGSLDARRARDLVTTGGADWRLALDHATERRLWSTNEEAAIAAVRQAQASGIDDTTRAELRERLIDGPLSEMDGRPALEVEEALEGEPTTPEGWVRRWERRQDLDRTWGAGLVDVNTTSGREYDRNVNSLRNMLDENGNVRPGLEQRFEEVRLTLEGDQRSYRTREDETAEVAAQAATVAASTVAVIATGGAATPAAAALVAAAGGGAGMLTRYAIEGDAYERENMLQDGVRTVADMAGGAAAAGGAMRNATILGRALQAAPGAELNMATNLAMTEHDIRLEDIGEEGLSAAGEIAGSVVGGELQDGILGTVPGVPSLQRRIIANAAGGAAEDAISTAAEVDTYEHGGLQALGRIAGAGLQGAATSSVEAFGEHREAHEQHERNQRELADRMRREALAGAGDDGVVDVDPSGRNQAASQASSDTADALIQNIVDETPHTAHTGDEPPSLQELAERARRNPPDEPAAATTPSGEPPSLSELADASREPHVEVELPPPARDHVDDIVDTFDPPEPHVEVDEPPSLADLAAHARNNPATNAPDPDLESAERRRERAREQAEEDEARPLQIGSTGALFDPDEVPQPGESPNYPPNNGFDPNHPITIEDLPPNTELHRVNSVHGTFFSPTATNVHERALPPRYGPDGTEMPELREERFFTVGEGGMRVEQGVIAPAFGEPGGGIQVREAGDQSSAADLMESGQLVLEQENIAQIASDEDAAEIEAAVAEEEAAERRRAEEEEERQRRAGS